MRLMIFIILFLKLSSSEAPHLIDHWIVWNVGQGQWVTEIKNEVCIHYDFGGEVFALKKIKPLFTKYCQQKTNQLYLSHADWDHYAFYNFIVKNNVSTCWKLKPAEELKKIDFEISACLRSKNPEPIHILFYNQFENLKKISRNETSTVLEANGILIPGDSPLRQEKKWAQHIVDGHQIHTLILGHHGSRTSTGDLLLNRLTHLKMAISTSRFKKYGHPHKEVLDRLKEHHLNAIKTEDWGTVLIE